MVFIKAPKLAARERQIFCWTGDRPSTDSCSPASPQSPCQFSQAWPGLRTTFNEIKRWFSQCLLRMPLYCLSPGWWVCETGRLLASLRWTMNNSREENGATKVKLDSSKALEMHPSMVFWGIQGSGYSKLSALWSAGNSQIPPAWGIVCYPGKGPLKYGTDSCWERVDVWCSVLQGLSATEQLASYIFLSHHSYFLVLAMTWSFASF